MYKNNLLFKYTLLAAN